MSNFFEIIHIVPLYAIALVGTVPLFARLFSKRYSTKALTNCIIVIASIGLAAGFVIPEHSGPACHTLVDPCGFYLSSLGLCLASKLLNAAKKAVAPSR